MLQTEFPEEGKLNKSTSDRHKIYLEGVCLRRINRGLNNEI